MRLSDITEVARFLRTFTTERQLANAYSELAAAVEAASQNQNPDEVWRKLDAIKTIQTAAQAELNAWSARRRELLERYAAPAEFGTEAIAQLDKAFHDYRVHAPGLVQVIRSIQKEISGVVTRSSKLIEGLGPAIEWAKPYESELQQGEGLLWLSFENRTDVATVADLNKAARTWVLIIGLAAKAAGEGTRPRLLSISKESPLQIEIAAAAGVLVPLGVGVSYVLRRIEQIVKILQQIEILKQHKAGTDFLRAGVADVRRKRKELLDEASAETAAQFKMTPEEQSSMRAALNRVLKFVEKGGRLDVEAEKPGESDGENKTASRFEVGNLLAEVQAARMALPAGEDLRLLLAGAEDSSADASVDREAPDADDATDWDQSPNEDERKFEGDGE